MPTFSSNFIGNFKRGDNICHSLASLRILYRYYSEESHEDNKLLLCQPMIILIAAVVEAIIADLVQRAQNYVREGLNGVPNEVLEKIRERQYDQFETLIACVKKYKLLGDSSQTDIYEDLDCLRKLRNRIHIQNFKNEIPKDLDSVFEQTNKTFSEGVATQLLQYCENNYKRPEHTNNHVGDFILPW